MVAQWVKDMVEDEFGETAMVVGEIIDHPDGRRVKVIGGSLWTAGGFSNFWTWREVLQDGELGPEEHGYGWSKAPETPAARP